MDELSEMRGKFISRSGVQFFGLSMETQWRTPLGSHHVNMQVNLNFQNIQPEADIKVGGTLGRATSRSVESQHSAEVVTKTSGTVQSIQASGSGNSVSNQLSLNVIDPDRRTQPDGFTADYQSQSQASTTKTSRSSATASSSALPNQSGAVASTSLATDMGSPSTSSLPVALDQPDPVSTDATSLASSFQTEAGITTTLSHGGGQLGYTIQSGPDRIVQKLGISDVHNTRQLIQSVQLHGDAHHVVNNIKMDVGMAAGRESRGTALRLHESLIGIL